jgi:hypothetical protein
MLKRNVNIILFYLETAEECFAVQTTNASLVVSVMLRKPVELNASVDVRQNTLTMVRHTMVVCFCCHILILIAYIVNIDSVVCY